MTKEDIVNQIHRHIDFFGSIREIEGIYGDQQGCGAYEKSVIKTEDGYLTEFYGCSYKFKGKIDPRIIDLLAVGKSLISVVPRHIILKDWIITLRLIYLIVFRRRKFLHLTRIYLTNLYIIIVNKVDFKDFCPFVKELRRCVWDSLAYCVKKDGLDLFSVPKGNGERLGLKLNHFKIGVSSRREMWEIIANIAEYAFLVLQFDNAYRFPLQDILSELDKEALKRSPIREIMRLCDVGISRAIHIKPKLKYLKLVFRFFLMSRKLREFAVKILENLNLERVRMDEADIYFNLNRQGYNFHGRTYQNRRAEWNRINEEKGHCILNL